MGAALAVRLSRDGTVEELLHDSVGAVAATVGRPFVDALVPGSLAKAISFLRELATASVAVDWELDVRCDGEVQRLRFAGVDDGRGLLALGTTDGDLEHILGQITGVTNELANRLREAVRAQAAAAAASDGLNDLTQVNNELTNLHRELARTSAELELLNERKNQVLGMAAHDLRNPLGAIMGFAEVLAHRAADRLDERELALLQHIRTSSERMTGLIEDLLDVSAIEAGALVLDLADHDVAALVEEVVDLERSRAQRKDIRIDLHTTRPTHARVDANRFLQVVQNLVSNAINYSYAGTVVDVRVERDGDHVALVVADQGQGIPEEDQANVFEFFGTTDVTTTGGERSTGLGLAIARSIVEAHGGTIGLTSEVGVGSTFVVELPTNHPGA